MGLESPVSFTSNSPEGILVEGCPHRIKRPRSWFLALGSNQHYVGRKPLYMLKNQTAQRDSSKTIPNTGKKVPADPSLKPGDRWYPLDPGKEGGLTGASLLIP